MIETLHGILDILWMLIKIGAAAFFVFFVWSIAIAAARKLREEQKHD